MSALRSGGCLCGAVRYEIRGEPLTSGLCHCADCRKESGSLFSAYAIWPRAALTYAGTVSVFAGRSFCPHCGGRLFCLTDEKAELRLGSLDGPPVGIEPAQEVWIIRRERWLHPVAGAAQFPSDPV